MEKEIMSPDNPRWDEFAAELSWVAGKCDTSRERPLARSILEKMGNIDIGTTMKYFDKHGGHCDCEIMFNIDPVKIP